MHRLKYSQRYDSSDVVNEVGGTKTLIGILGDDAHYRMGRNFGELGDLRDSLPDGRYALELLEFYAFDLLSHWNLHLPSVIDKHLRLVDGFIEALHDRCREKDVAMMVLVDHGQEAVRGCIDMKRIIDSADVPRSDLCYYIEVAVARFWFRTEEARQAVLGALSRVQHIEVMHRRELERYDICFEDDRFGEFYAIADSGYIFFPHDFHHPLANLFMALREPTMRRRLFNPRQRGYHGHLPDHPAEKGFLMLLDEDHQAILDPMKLIDFAPTVLNFLKREKPDYMSGRPVFQRNE